LVVAGIATGYFISHGTARIATSSASWRTPLAFQAVVAFSFASACFTIPPSPRWLLTRGRLTKAQAVLERLGLASSELEEIMQQPVEDAGGIVQSGLVSSIEAKFKDFAKVLSKDARKQAALACFIMMMQQFSGIDGVLYYAPLLFQQAGLTSEKASFLASGVSALVILAVTIPASIYSDHWGRRASTITGGVLLTACMLLIGSLYAANSVHGGYGAARWVVVVAIYFYALVYCGTWGIGFRLYASEIQPRATRASASCLAQSANWVRTPNTFLPYSHILTV